MQGHGSGILKLLPALTCYTFADKFVLRFLAGIVAKRLPDSLCVYSGYISPTAAKYHLLASRTRYYFHLPLPMTKEMRGKGCFKGFLVSLRSTYAGRGRASQKRTPVFVQYRVRNSSTAILCGR